ncbi:polysaccharide lyase family 1 protein [Dothidotthia symphoricarpi CBS 119687]|uniref:pectin lyase n=1 Tax=Dothidotthia symphoricarpi CBS 119687 TaxID=1392245 RepID=A0A6A6AAW1_9PLEO|nr:polysaccharide lyase family 1 protein [Dothidotthia symphoricarpi CBS 119687]KAF2128960.1 polysaccharide lyase family 1 protein [Dothidotthia symphoricarpi CBS 119687]
MVLTKSLVLAFLASTAAAAGVTGTAVGFAAKTTGGGDAEPVYPTTIEELTTYLTDSEARVIILNKEFNYIGSEGETTENGCRPDSNTCPDDGGQDAINGADWCTNSDYPLDTSVTYDNAAITPINLGSNKSIVGEGTAGVIRGKGLRIANDAQNIIIQNIHITELNPQYIWGGDAITLAGTDLVWIDHVKTSLIGRQHIVTGYSPSGSVTISNCEIDGNTSWSASCDNHHYWAILFLGTDDKITMQGNYIHHTSGRSPKIGGTDSGTLLHAVNNYWYDNTGHAFAISENGRVLAEGNVFESVTTPVESGTEYLFAALTASANAVCEDPLGYVCQVNQLTSSGDWAGSGSDFLDGFSGEGVEAVAASTVAASVKSNAGVGKL